MIFFTSRFISPRFRLEEKYFPEDPSGKRHFLKAPWKGISRPPRLPSGGLLDRSDKGVGDFFLLVLAAGLGGQG